MIDARLRKNRVTPLIACLLLAICLLTAGCSAGGESGLHLALTAIRVPGEVAVVGATGVPVTVDRPARGSAAPIRLTFNRTLPSGRLQLVVLQNGSALTVSPEGAGDTALVWRTSGRDLLIQPGPDRAWPEGLIWVRLALIDAPEAAASAAFSTVYPTPYRLFAGDFLPDMPEDGPLFAPVPVMAGDQREVAVVTEPSSLKTTASDAAPDSGRLHRGDSVIVVERADSWIKVRAYPIKPLADLPASLKGNGQSDLFGLAATSGVEGFVPATSLQPLAQPANPSSLLLVRRVSSDQMQVVVYTSPYGSAGIPLQDPARAGDAGWIGALETMALLNWRDVAGTSYWATRIDDQGRPVGPMDTRAHLPENGWTDAEYLRHRQSRAAYTEWLRSTWAGLKLPPLAEPHRQALLAWMVERPSHLEDAWVAWGFTHESFRPADFGRVTEEMAPLGEPCTECDFTQAIDDQSFTDAWLQYIRAYTASDAPRRVQQELQALLESAQK